MAFCGKCGGQLTQGVAFCPACGAAASGQAISTGAGTGVAPAQAPVATGMQNNVAGMLCYLFGWVTGLIFLLIDPYKNDKFVRFNAFQAIFLSVSVIAIWIASLVLTGILGVITRGVGFFLMGPIMMLVWLGVLVLHIVCMVKAYGNQKFKLPFIGDLAEKQAG